MDTFQTFKKTLKMTWRYRALWLFGFLLALKVSNVFWLAFKKDQDEDVVVNNRIILNDSTIIWFPGEGLTVDFRGSGPPQIEVEGLEPGWYQELSDQLDLGDISVLLVSFGVILVISYLIRTLLRHTSRAALFQMVDGYGDSEQMFGLRRGFRLGWSKVAWKLFLIELVINLPVTLFFSLLLFVTISPFFLFGMETISTSTPIVFGILFLVAAGFMVNLLLLLVVGLVLSMVKPVIRLACAVDGLSVFVSITQGFKTFYRRYKDVFITWSVVLVVRFAWTILVIPVFLLLLPLLIVMILIGLLVGGILAAIVAGISSLFVSAVFAWIIGVIAVLPLFVKITFSPITFLSGLVNVIRSGFWTLSYREFRIPADPILQQPGQPGQVEEQSY